MDLLACLAIERQITAIILLPRFHVQDIITMVSHLSKTMLNICPDRSDRQESTVMSVCLKPHLRTEYNGTKLISLVNTPSKHNTVSRDKEIEKREENASEGRTRRQVPIFA
jgi:hypothetical protein